MKLLQLVTNHTVYRFSLLYHETTQKTATFRLQFPTSQLLFLQGKLQESAHFLRLWCCREIGTWYSCQNDYSTWPKSYPVYHLYNPISVGKRQHHTRQFAVAVSFRRKLLTLRQLSHGQNICFYFADVSDRTSSDTASTCADVSFLYCETKQRGGEYLN